MSTTELFASAVGNHTTRGRRAATWSSKLLRTALSSIPTPKPGAYDYYLRGRTFVEAPGLRANSAAIRAAGSRRRARLGLRPRLRVALGCSRRMRRGCIHWAPIISTGPERGRTALQARSQLPDALQGPGSLLLRMLPRLSRALSTSKKAGHARRPGRFPNRHVHREHPQRTGQWTRRSVLRGGGELDPGGRIAPQPEQASSGCDATRRRSARAGGRWPRPRDAFAYTIWASVPLLRDGDLAAARSASL